MAPVQPRDWIGSGFPPTAARVGRSQQRTDQRSTESGSRLVDAVAVHVVVRPRVPVNGHPGCVGLGVEGAGGGVGLVGGDSHGGVAVSLEVRAPGLVGLVPVAGGSGVVPAMNSVSLP